MTPQNDARPVILIYGNCQAQFLHLLVTQSPSLCSRFEFVLASALVEPGNATPTVPEEAGRAALYWEQYVQQPALAYRNELRACVPGNCAVVRYPAVGLNAFWPFFVKDARNTPEPGYPWGRYPAGDRLAIEVGELGLPPERAYERYMQLSREQMPDVRKLLARERDVFIQRDAESDVKMTDFVFERLQSTYQFWTRVHLAVPVFAELLSRLLERSKPVIGDIGDAARAELKDAYARFPGQGDFQHPIHPMVAEQLELKFAGERTKYRWFGESWTFQEHMTRYLAFDRSW